MATKPIALQKGIKPKNPTATGIMLGINPENFDMEDTHTKEVVEQLTKEPRHTMSLTVWNCYDNARCHVAELHVGNLYRIRPAHRKYWIDVRDDNGKFTITKVTDTADHQDVAHGEGEVLLSEV